VSIAERDLTIDEASELVNDDIAYWLLENPFMTPDLIAAKVCYWVTIALNAAATEDHQ
jgi:hypothetical protein